MRCLALLFLLFVSAIATAAERPQVTLYKSASAVTEACDAALTVAQARADALAKTDPRRLFAGWNEMDAALEDVLGSIGLQTYVHPDKAIRDAGEGCIVKAAKFQAGLFQTEPLYKQVDAVDAEDAIDEKLREDMLNLFTDTGVNLPPKRRARAKEIIEKTQALDQEFDRNLRENTTKLTFARDELKGLPDSYLAAHKKEKDGSLKLGFDYPDYVPFMTFAEKASARERYFKAFQSRGTTRNLEILDEIVRLRAELAGLHEMDSYAELVTARNMVEDPDTVLDFLKDVRKVVDEVEDRDMQMLREQKAQHIGSKEPDAVRVYPWDKEFYLERLRRARHNIDQEALRKYFPAEETRAWVLKISGDLYGLKFQPRKSPAWHKDVLLYDVLDAASTTYIGSVYLDLYPRPGKYGHAAAFPLRGSSAPLQRTPITALVTNFDRKGLNPQEVETFLHEFGHALHGILSHTRYVAQAGTSVPRDFVEAPSQMYEEWARRPETLRLMSAVCKKCPLVDDDLAARLDASRRLGSGLLYGRQHLYASFDMTLAGEDPQPALEVWKKLEAKTPFGYTEDTQFPGTFAHIAGGYAAGYYGYMWAEALALDMRSAFGDNLMDAKVGGRFREQVLARGGEVKADKLVRKFLGRKPKNDAFFAEIRGERKQ